MTLIWPSKVTRGQTDYVFRFAAYDLLLVFYSNYSAISHRNPVFQHMTLIWPFKVTKGQTDYVILFATYMTSYLCCIVTIALSRTETLFFSIWPRSDLSRSPNVKLIFPFDLRLMTSYLQSIVTISLSRFVYEIFAVKLLKTLPEIRHLTFSGSLTSTDSSFHLTIC